MSYYCKVCYEREDKQYTLVNNQCPNCNRKVTYLPKAKLSHLKNHSISRFKTDLGVSIGGMQTLNNPNQDTWKPTVHKKISKASKPTFKVIKDESNDIKIEIHEDKKSYQMIIEKATNYQIKDDMLILNKKEFEKEIILPKNVKLETAEVTETNGILAILFQKEKKNV